jgi:NAD(P)-dependent dehydrogenase (short-subunit alcohol dehydrogenase family)
MRDFSGRTAVVTGAANGIGLEIARALAAEGANLVVADLHGEAAENVAAELRSNGTRAIGVQVDVAKLDDMKRLAALATAEFGNIHVLCNNAGIDGYRGGGIWQAGDIDWAWAMGVNFDGTLNGLRAFVDDMLAHGEEAHIANTVSESGLTKQSSMYGITKHASLALTEVLDEQLKARGSRIGVTALCPGPVRTRFFESPHRPAELMDESPGSDLDVGRARRAELQAHIQGNGVTPAEVASRLLDGIRENRLYVLTDATSREGILRRADEMVRGFAG